MTCECSMRTKLIGDGCEICNPEKALEYAKDALLESESHRRDLISLLKEMRNALAGKYMLSPEGRAYLKKIDAVLMR